MEGIRNTGGVMFASSSVTIGFQVLRISVSRTGRLVQVVGDAKSGVPTKSKGAVAVGGDLRGVSTTSRLSGGGAGV